MSSLASTLDERKPSSSLQIVGLTAGDQHCHGQSQYNDGPIDPLKLHYQVKSCTQLGGMSRAPLVAPTSRMAHWTLVNSLHTSISLALLIN